MVENHEITTEEAFAELKGVREKVIVKETKIVEKKGYDPYEWDMLI